MRPARQRQRFLSADQAARVYDRIGRLQDLQAVYEHRAVDDLVAHGEFEHAQAVLELGYGTAALARRLLARHLPATCRYVGVDVSPRMHRLAAHRLAEYSNRADVQLSDGSLPLSFADASFDRFIAAYVVDLLSPEHIAQVLGEAHRLVAPEGLLCVASLTDGATPAATHLTRAWEALWKVSPGLLGGCRPLRLTEYLDPRAWRLHHRSVVTAFAVSSEVIVASPLHEPPRPGPSTGTATTSLPSHQREPQLPGRSKPSV